MWLNWPLFFPFLLWYISDFSSLSSWYPFSISLAVLFDNYLLSTFTELVSVSEIYAFLSTLSTPEQSLSPYMSLFTPREAIVVSNRDLSSEFQSHTPVCLFCIFTWISNCCLWLYILQIETPPTNFLLFISEWHHCTQNMQAKVLRVILISCLSPFCQSPSLIDLACLIPRQSIHPLPSFSLVTSLSPHHHLSVLLLIHL